MLLTNIGELFASRTLKWTDNNYTRVVMIAVGKPLKFPEVFLDSFDSQNLEFHFPISSFLHLVRLLKCLC